ncbi:angiopoietin-related protein 3-like [Sinocyclocheilus grahami]|uniref:angiopoietin-related protein 3-like n=1 Tax=Sinocyclocheilus grahami TaxID=75366 RepID=UPI0007ACFFF5|nr:PREDICTED: angiopoietin-related protein 3-like [Sinocyclocheilus grahami]
MKLLVLLLLLASTHSFPTEPTFPEHQTESRLRFAALDEVRLLANGLLQLGHSLRDFVQNTKSQIKDIFQKLNIFDKSFYQLSVLASEIKEEEEELKKTTVILKANNEEIKSLSLEINSKVEDIIKERKHLRRQVGGLEETLSGLSQSLLSAEQVVEISTLKRAGCLRCLCFVGEFWLGLKKIYAVAHQGHSLLHVQIEDWRKEKHFMLYQYILEDAAFNYTIHLKLQTGESSSALDQHSGFRFSTKDHNDGNRDLNCAQDYTGGWWFSICGDINLNGKCIQSRPRKKGTHWKPGKGTTSFKASKISISHLTKPQTP